LEGTTGDFGNQVRQLNKSIEKMLRYNFLQFQPSMEGYLALHRSKPKILFQPLCFAHQDFLVQTPFFWMLRSGISNVFMTATESREAARRLGLMRIRDGVQISSKVLREAGSTVQEFLSGGKAKERASQLIRGIIGRRRAW
jgi:hypothetical protein